MGDWFLVLLLIKPLPDGSDGLFMRREDGRELKGCVAAGAQYPPSGQLFEGNLIIFKGCVFLRPEPAPQPEKLQS